MSFLHLARVRLAVLRTLLSAQFSLSKARCSSTFVSSLHALSLGGDQVSKQVGAVTLARAAIHDTRDVADTLVLNLRLILLERKDLVELGRVRDLLKLPRITGNLLLKVLDTLRNRLGNQQVVLNALHGSTRLRLLNGILGECVVRVQELFDLLLLEVNLGHLAVVVSQLLVVIVVIRLSLLFNFVDWRLGLIFSIDDGSGCNFSLSLSLLDQLSRCFYNSGLHGLNLLRQSGRLHLSRSRSRWLNNLLLLNSQLLEVLQLFRAKAKLRRSCDWRSCQLGRSNRSLRRDLLQSRSKLRQLCRSLRVSQDTLHFALEHLKQLVSLHAVNLALTLSLALNLRGRADLRERHTHWFNHVCESCSRWVAVKLGELC